MGTNPPNPPVQPDPNNPSPFKQNPPPTPAADEPVEVPEGDTE